MLPALRKLLNRPDPSAAELQRELDKFDERFAKASVALAGAEAARGEAWREGEVAARKNREFIAQTAEELRDMEAARPMLVRRLEERRSAEADAHRLQRYRQAEAASARAKDALLDRLPKHIEEHFALIRLLEEARQQIELANANLPPDCDGIPDPETEIRDLAALPRQVLSEARKIVWSRTDVYPGKRIDPAKVKNFEDLGGGHGRFPEKTPHGLEVWVPCLGHVEVTQQVALFEQGERGSRLRDIPMPGLRYYEPGYAPLPWHSPTPESVLFAVTNAQEHRVIPDRGERFIRKEVTSEPLLARESRLVAAGLRPSDAPSDPSVPRSPGRAARASSHMSPNQQRDDGFKV